MGDGGGAGDVVAASSSNAADKGKGNKKRKKQQSRRVVQTGEQDDIISEHDDGYDRAEDVSRGGVAQGKPCSRKKRARNEVVQAKRSETMQQESDDRATLAPGGTTGLLTELRETK